MNRLIVIVGPTAVGKSELALKLAMKFGCEIISGDSMCVYRGMDIGTAKASLAERGLLPHHLIDIRDPGEDFSVVDFQKLANEAIEQINQRGNIPILVGGTGLYVQALLEGYRFNPTPRTAQRENIPDNAETESEIRLLHDKLLAIDPDSARRIHPNDRKRILRAMEIAQIENCPISHQKSAETPELLFDSIVFGITLERQELYRRINERVDSMVNKGLISEVQAIIDIASPETTALQAIGYKEIAAYLKGIISLEEAIALVKQSSRRYAKRQMTWFRRMPYIHWITQNGEDALTGMFRQVAEKYSIK